MFVPWREPIKKLKPIREQLLRKQEQEKRKQLQLKTMQKVILTDLKVKSVLKMQSFFSQKLQHVLVRLKSVRWGRRCVRGLLIGGTETVVWSTIPTLLMESKTLEVPMR